MMSFGEATATPNYGRFIDLAEEVASMIDAIALP